MYYRYINDTFAVFNDEDECNEFFCHLNSLHPPLRFTLEKECNRNLPFLDVLVEKNDFEFVTSIYRKRTFTSQYIRWNSFCPMKRKTNLISTLVHHRALVICSKSTIQNELSKIRTILINNGYHEAVINTVITKKMNQFRRPTQLGPKKCPVYLHLPWLGKVSMRYKMQIKLSNAVTLQLNHSLSTPPDNFCLQRKRIYYQLYIKATLFINFCATVLVSTWVVLLKGYNRGLSSTCLKPFFGSIFLRTEAHWPALASQSEALNLKLHFLP